MIEDWWWQALLTFGYGLGGAIIPIANVEAFIVAVLATRLIDPITLGLAMGLGQSVGKAIMFQLVRRGLQIPWPARSGEPSRLGRWLTAVGRKRWLQALYGRWRQAMAWGRKMVEHPRWGPVGLFLSGSISLPPSYPTTILVAATKINALVFALSMGSGFTLRCVLMALAADGLLGRIF